MSDYAIQVEALWKKFRRGELYDSLRDLFPAMATRLFRWRREELAAREFWALRDVTFAIERGQSLGIIGPNGAGKSTMLKLLSGIIRPTRGACHVRGRCSALIEVGPGFHPDLTGRENLYLNAAILGMKKREIRAKAEQIIDFSGVEEFIDTPVKRYSSGMKARLGFAIAAHLEPDVLLVDEVLSVGDAKFRQKCLQHMRQLMRSEVTVIFISHILEQVRQLCPRTVVLNQGALVYDGATSRAIKVYLDLLSDSERSVAAGEDAEIRHVRLCTADGREAVEWALRQPGVIEFELVLRRPFCAAIVLINVASVGGVYLGTINSMLDEVPLPCDPGRYHVRFTFDPLPLADGDYLLDFAVYDRPGGQPVWISHQPRTLSVRGTQTTTLGPLLLCDGRWEVAVLTAVDPPGRSLPPAG